MKNNMVKYVLENRTLLNFKEPKKLIYTIPFSKVSEEALIYNEAVKMLPKNEIQIVTKGKTHDIEFLKNIDIRTIYNEINKSGQLTKTL